MRGSDPVPYSPGCDEECFGWVALCGPRWDRMWMLPGQPPVKRRPRFHAGRAYHDPAAREAETRTAWYLNSYGWPVKDRFEIRMLFRRATGRRVDVDNLVKHVLDAGNRVAWTDDALAVEVAGRLGPPLRDHPHTHVALRTVRDRGERSS